MPSFATTFLDRLAVPADLVQTIRQIGEHKGGQELYRVQAPEKLENLRQVAMIQSVESSNRIEGVVAANGRVEALVRGKTEPQNRPEGEIAGYRDVLATIHSQFADIRLDGNVVLQFHRDLMKYATGAGGVWKSALNEIVEVRPDGTRRIRFTPTAPHLTPAAMQALHRDFAAAIRRLPQRQPRLDQDRARPTQEGRPAQAFRPRADRPLAQGRNRGVRREIGAAKDYPIYGSEAAPPSWFETRAPYGCSPLRVRTGARSSPRGRIRLGGHGSRRSDLAIGAEAALDRNPRYSILVGSAQTCERSRRPCAPDQVIRRQKR
jgi:hypothetical protein